MIVGMTPLHSVSQRLNLLWSALAVAFAVEAFSEAWLFRDAQAFVYCAMHLQAAFLFIFRDSARHYSRFLSSYAVAIASTLYVYLFELGLPSFSQFYTLGVCVTFLGSIFALLATWNLGRCYGVLPIARGLRTNRMYGVVRHPIYASYIVMDIGILLAFPTVWNFGVFVMAIGLYILRIQFEENVLEGFNRHAAYRQKVRFRLAPGFF